MYFLGDFYNEANFSSKRTERVRASRTKRGKVRRAYVRTVDVKARARRDDEFDEQGQAVVPRGISEYDAARLARSSVSTASRVSQEARGWLRILKDLAVV